MGGYKSNVAYYHITLPSVSANIKPVRWPSLKECSFGVFYFFVLFIFFKRYLCWCFYYSEVHSTLTASAMGGKHFVEMKLLLQQGCLWHFLIQKGARTQYIDRGWSVLYIQKRGITSVLPSDIDVGRGDKNKCIFFPVLKHAKTKMLITSWLQLRIIIIIKKTALEMPHCT